MNAIKLFVPILVLSFLFARSAAAGDDYHGVMTQDEAAQGASKITVCSSCHGMHGVAVAPQYPNLAGQNYNYILKQLENFRSGARTNKIMSVMVRIIPKEQENQNIKDIAAYFSSQKRPAPAADPSDGKGQTQLAAQVQLGRDIYQRGLPLSHVPACAACHGMGGEGNGPMAVPALAGQNPKYLMTQLDNFAQGHRANSPGHVMYGIARALTASQRLAVTVFLRQLNPASTLGIGPKDIRAIIKQVNRQEAGAGKGPAGQVAATASKPQTGAGTH